MLVCLKKLKFFIIFKYLLYQYWQILNYKIMKNIAYTIMKILFSTKVYLLFNLTLYENSNSLMANFVFNTKKKNQGNRNWNHQDNFSNHIKKSILFF